MSPKPDKKKYSSLINDIEEGRIKIPRFQRDFVWSIEKTAKLLDSILKGYPIGTFIIWRTSERMNEVKEIGNFKLPETPEGDTVQYVLDGQQRITSLFAAYRGEEIKKNGRKSTNYRDIVVNLDKGLDESNDQIITAGPTGERCVPLSAVLNPHHSESQEHSKLNDGETKLISNYFKVFNTYTFSMVFLQKEDIDSAIEVFTRINTGGKPLTPFEIMSAKTYDEEQKFDMQVKWEAFTKELKAINYEGVSSKVVLHLLSLFLSNPKECRKKTILGLDKQAIIDKWEDAISALKDSIDYFRTTYRIPVSQLLPYDSLLVPFAYFFSLSKKQPDSDQRKYLEEYFWRISLSYRYSSSTESKLAQDIKRMDQILDHQRPDYSDINVILDPETFPDALINTNFSLSSSYCKAILCLLARQKPKDFQSNGEVRLDNSNLQQANSKNYHHFFPKKYLEDEKIANGNSLVNITFVRDGLNKSIGAKAPSEYINGFKEENPDINEALNSHLIDIEGFGIWDNNYDAFLKARAQRIFDELKDLLNP